MKPTDTNTFRKSEREQNRARKRKENINRRIRLKGGKGKFNSRKSERIREKRKG